jgi:hypothetical protein
MAQSLSRIQRRSSPAEVGKRSMREWAPGHKENIRIANDKRESHCCGARQLRYTGEDRNEKRRRLG